MYKPIVFLGAFLLFAVQPMIGRGILPLFGGGAGVWLACMMFFQISLLVGYAYAHGMIVRLNPVGAKKVHTGFILLCLLSLGLGFHWAGAPWLPSSAVPGAHHHTPQVAILLVLGLTAGLPIVVLSTTSPLVQAIYARVEGKEPYPLYAVSNWGSLLGLLSYPILLEPRIGLHLQAWLVTLGFVLYIVMVLILLNRSLSAGGSVESKAAAAPFEPRGTAKVEAVKWTGLATLGSIWLLAISNLLSTVVASMPLMWIPPLALYLVTFIWAFDAKVSPRSKFVRILGAFILLLFCVFEASWHFLSGLIQALRPSFPGSTEVLKSLSQAITQATLFRVLLSLAALFSACILCHGRLRELKPEPARLTSFYFWIAVGGALGGLFVGVVAPLVFNQNYELILVLGSSSCLAMWDFRTHNREGSYLGLIPATLALTLALVDLAGRLLTPFEYHARDFFGTITIRRPHANVLTMTHGSTRHGLEIVKEPLRPVAYYGEDSGFGRVIRTLQASRPSIKVGIVGLGVGNAAAFGRPEDHFTFYEISPKVIQISGPKGTHFSVLKSCLSKVTVKEGDGRKLIEEEIDRESPLDLVLIDAFAGGHIPAHLLTKEALQAYFRRLKPDGILMLHVSHHLPVTLIAGADLRDLGAYGIVLHNLPNVWGRDSHGFSIQLEYGSNFWAASRDKATLFIPQLLEHAARLTIPKAETGTLRAVDLDKLRIFEEESSGVTAWTDERHSLTDLLVYKLTQRGRGKSH